MLKARTGFDSRLLTWERIWMGCSKSDLSGGRGPLPPLPLLTKEGSEKPQKLPTRFGEEPLFKIDLEILEPTFSHHQSIHGHSKRMTVLGIEPGLISLHHG